MEWLQKFKCWLIELLRNKHFESELEEELAFHFEMQKEQLRSSGMNPEAANREAHIQFGGKEQVKEELRHQRAGHHAGFIWRDITYGIRMLLKSPGFTAISIITLGLGIGTAVSIFSIVFAVLLKPLPYPHPETIVRIWDTNPILSIEKTGSTSGGIKEWRRRSRSFDGIAGGYVMGRTLNGPQDSEVILSAQVSTDFFKIFGIQPQLGRTFTEEETDRSTFNSAATHTGVDPVLVLSHKLWIRRFGGKSDIIGKTIQLERKFWRVIGIMPAEFAVPSPDTDLWVPWSYTGELPHDQHYVTAYARIKPGISIKQAEDELKAIVKQVASEKPEIHKGWSVYLVDLQESISGESREFLWILFGASGVVLLIASVNISILQLARATSRTREAAVRLSLGASRFQLMRQFFLESLLLASAGGALGFLFATIGISLIKAQDLPIPRIHEIAIHSPVLMFSLLITIFSAILFGCLPALSVSISNPLQILQQSGGRILSGKKSHFTRNILVATEIAFAVILLAGAGLLTRSFLKLREVDPGFNPSQVIVMPIFLDLNTYTSGEPVREYYRRLMEQLENLPGVESVGGATALPASPLGPDFERPVWAQTELSTEDQKHHADVRMVTTDYFRTLGIRVIRGRGFTSEDSAKSPKVVMINERLANRIWPNQNPVGKQLVVDYSTAGTYPYEVIGVVNNIRFYGIRSEPRSEIYFPHVQRPYLVLNIAVRTASDPRYMTASFRKVLHDVDPQQPAHSIMPLEELVGKTIQREKLAMLLVGGFALSSLMLALLGIYGVLAYTVKERTREIGIRIALGASNRQIIRWIFSNGAALTAAGLIAGLAITLLITRLLSGLLFQVGPYDPAAYVAVIVLIAITVTAASIIPSRRASSIDPNTALRYE